ncbi:hypothetical protein GGI07_004562 [Coemansia sp. Benny D115]|nr:hypothetical protein GGI07_004562 [Coemansia sp. Benny D115]
MRFSLIVAQVFAATALAAPALIKRQEFEVESGDSVSGGPAAVSNPNVNNGQQIDSSLITSGSDGANNFANVFGSSFTKVNSNSANKDNIVINPSTTTINGNSGATANGAHNNIGDSQNVIPGVFGLFRKRDVVVTGGVFEHFYPEHPVFFGVDPYAPIGFEYVHPVPASFNQQNAAIIQNRA